MVARDDICKWVTVFWVLWGKLTGKEVSKGLLGAETSLVLLLGFIFSYSTVKGAEKDKYWISRLFETLIYRVTPIFFTKN